MNIDIRESIISNFSDCNKDDIIASIDAAIKDKDEVTLPGMGVFFELLWQNSNHDLKKEIIKIIFNSIKK